MNLPIVYYINMFLIQELLLERATSEQTDLYGYTNMSNLTCKTYNMIIEVNEDQKNVKLLVYWPPLLLSHAVPTTFLPFRPKFEGLKHSSIEFPNKKASICKLPALHHGVN